MVGRASACVEDIIQFIASSFLEKGRGTPAHLETEVGVDDMQLHHRQGKWASVVGM